MRLRSYLPYIVTSLIVADSACFSEPAASGAAIGNHSKKQTPQMKPKSIVLRSSHIVLVKVSAANATDWGPSKPGLKSRKVDLSLEIIQILRGKLDAAQGGKVRIRITQSSYAGMLRMQPLPGVWSQVELVSGAELVVFAQSNASGVEDVFTEPGCIRVGPAKPMLPGLRIATKAMAESLHLNRVLGLAGPESPHLDSTFAEFLWGHYGVAAMDSQPDFDALAGFAERKDLDVATRNSLLGGGYDCVALHGDDNPHRAQRLALAMLRVLLLPDAADLHENLIGTDLPNLLGITSELPRQAATDVFKGHESERDALAAFLHHHGTSADAKPLQAWLNVK